MSTLGPQHHSLTHIIIPSISFGLGKSNPRWEQRELMLKETQSLVPLLVIKVSTSISFFLPPSLPFETLSLGTWTLGDPPGALRALGRNWASGMFCVHVHFCWEDPSYVLAASQRDSCHKRQLVLTPFSHLVPGSCPHQLNSGSIARRKCHSSLYSRGGQTYSIMGLTVNILDFFVMRQNGG